MTVLLLLQILQKRDTRVRITALRSRVVEGGLQSQAFGEGSNPSEGAFEGVSPLGLDRVHHGQLLEDTTPVGREQTRAQAAREGSATHLNEDLLDSLGGLQNPFEASPDLGLQLEIPHRPVATKGLAAI